MTTMTLEQVRDGLAPLAKWASQYSEPDKNNWQKWINAIDAHLAQPAQAVDVETLRSIAAEMMDSGTFRRPIDPRQYARQWSEAVTRALSGEKAGPVEGRSPLQGKYGEVLEPFVAMMERELHANAGKGDRPGWLSMTPAIGMLEIYYHAAKLQKAVKDSDGDRIREYAADVANMSMMLADVCGAIPASPAPDKEG